MARKSRKSPEFDFEPVRQWGPDGVDEYLVEDRPDDSVKTNQYETGDGQPDPFRHLGKKA